MNWMQRLKRVFHLDIEHCPLCGGTLRVIACIEAPDLIERILAHLAAREADSVHLELPRSRGHIWAFVTSTEVSDRRWW